MHPWRAKHDGPCIETTRSPPAIVRTRQCLPKPMHENELADKPLRRHRCNGDLKHHF
jgi:hypothetical protein